MPHVYICYRVRYVNHLFPSLTPPLTVTFWVTSSLDVFPSALKLIHLGSWLYLFAQGGKCACIYMHLLCHGVNDARIAWWPLRHIVALSFFARSAVVIWWCLVPQHLALSELHPCVPAFVTPYQERLSYGKHNNNSHGWSLLNFPHDGHEAIGMRLFGKSWYFSCKSRLL